MKQLATLAFFAKYPGWHTFHRSARPQVRRLAALGFLRISGDQAKFTEKVFA